MKLVVLFFALVFAAFSQAATGQLCWTPDKTVLAKTVCRDLSPALQQSLKAFITTQTIQTGTDAGGKPVLAPKYSGIGDLLFTALADGVFTPIIDQFPPANVATAKAAVDADTAALTANKAAHIGKVSIVEPK